ncbi:dTMP kinase [Limnohabitans sp. Rim8]|uniref:dTMP kinase n=1 Tax=Limnohabitans sp. Rim8 TaxID=1100718 RepID=UPI0026159131|nr:dTMP kinase [Limnohabitans sp. Rim8]
MTRGLFISLEGIDGAGKSSHIDGLAALLRDQGRQVTLTREPGGTPLSEKLRDLVLHEPMEPLTEALLMFAARQEHIVQVIEPALTRGDVVLCDRFTDATFAYQGGGRGFDWQVLETLEDMVQKRSDALDKRLLQPDLTVWFDLPPSVAAKRLVQARIPDKFEAQPLAFFENVREGYARRCAQNPARFAQINANQSRESVWLEVENIVKNLLASSHQTGHAP